MHGGLICIAICMSECLSVTWPKCRLEKKSLDKKSYRRDMACLYVTRPKFRLEKKSLDKKSNCHIAVPWSVHCRPSPKCSGHTVGHKVESKPKKHMFSLHCIHCRYTPIQAGPNKGRWAHFNVKLHFFLFLLNVSCLPFDIFITSTLVPFQVQGPVWQVLQGGIPG